MSNLSARYDYCSFKTKATAERMLEHLYAAGEIDFTDGAVVERRGDRWYISLKIRG